MIGHRRKIHFRHRAGLRSIPAGNADGALPQGLAFVRNDQIRIHLCHRAQAGTGGASAERAVKGKHSGRQFLHADAAIRAGIVGAHHGLFAGIGILDGNNALRERQRRFQTVVDSPLGIFPYHNTIHHSVNGVFFRLCQLFMLFGQVYDFPVHHGPGKTVFAQVFQHLHMLALALSYHGGQQQNPLSLAHGQHIFHHLVNALLFDGLAAFRAVRLPDPRIQQAQIIMNFRHRAHRGARVSGGGFLVDGNGRRQPLDGFHIRLFHLPQKHARIRGQRFHIAPLPFGIDGIKRKAALSAAG